MLVTITQYSRMALDANGNPIYLGDNRIACEARTAAGAFTALDAATRFIRLATDTSIQMDITGGETTSADELFPEGSVEHLPMNGGEVLNIIVAA